MSDLSQKSSSFLNNDNGSHSPTIITGYTPSPSIGHLQTSSKSYPCEVCEDTTGKCRHTDRGGMLCMPNSDAKLFDIINGWKCVKEAGNSLWSTWVLDNRSELSQQEYKPTQCFKEKVVTLKTNSKLSNAERNEQHIELFNELDLHPDDRADLIRRGFTDFEIVLGCFKSIRKGQKLKGTYKDLAGIKNGNEFVINYDGYICPVRDKDGLIVGIQLRKRNADDGGRYLWFSSIGCSVHIDINGTQELPLAVFKPSETPIGIAIVEGIGAKPFYVAQRLGYLVIGAAGGQWSSSPNQLKAIIEKANVDYPGLDITIFPDANWCLDIHVTRRLNQTIDIIDENFSNQIKIADWNQITYKRGDIDELPNGYDVRYLKLDAWKKKYKEVFRTNFKGEPSKAFINWAKARKDLKPDITQNEKYLSIPENINEQCNILIVRKALGGGKTQGLINLLKKLGIDATFLIGYRNSLIYQTISRANKAKLPAVHIKDIAEKIGGTTVDFSQDDATKLIGGCADSFDKLEAVMAIKENYAVAIDEIVSVLNHLKNGGTLKKRQQKAIDWVISSIHGSQFTILMDANVCDNDVELIQKLFPDKKIKVIDSLHEVKQKVFNFIETNDDRAEYSSNGKYTPANLTAIAKQFENVLWLSDSQRSCETVDLMMKKQGANTFRLDGKTSVDDESKVFLNDPDEYIKTKNINILSLSPSAESGLSIALEGHFDVVCVDIKGVLNVNSLVQLMGRLRDATVPIFVSCPEFVNFTTKANTPNSVQELARMLLVRLAAFEGEVDKFAPDVKDLASMMVEVKDDFTRKLNDDHLFLSGLQDAHRDVYEKGNLRLTLKTALCQDGHIVKDWVENADTETHKEVKETKELVIRSEAEKIFNSVDITFEEAETLSQSEQKYDVKCQVQKAKLREFFPGIEDTGSWNAEFVETQLKDSKFLGAYWRLQQLKNPELAQCLGFLQYGERLSKVDFKLNNTEILNMSIAKLAGFIELGVLEYIEAEKFSTSKDSKGLSAVSIVKKYYSDDRLYNLIGIKRVPINKTYVMTMIKKLVGYFGLEVKQVGKSMNEKFFACVTPKSFDPYIYDIDKCLQKRAEQKIDEAKTKREMIEAARLSPEELDFVKNPEPVKEVAIIKDDVKVVETAQEAVIVSDVDVKGVMTEMILNWDNTLEVGRIIYGLNPDTKTAVWQHLQTDGTPEHRAHYHTSIEHFKLSIAKV